MGRNTVGVDLGGTKVKAALVREDGTILYSVRKLTNAAAGSDCVIATVSEAVQECLQHGTSTAVGLGVAGQIDPHSGDVIFAPNLGWRHVPLRAELQRQVGLPVLIMNDVRAATFGEWTYRSCAAGYTHALPVGRDGHRRWSCHRRTDSRRLQQFSGRARTYDNRRRWTPMPMSECRLPGSICWRMGHSGTHTGTHTARRRERQKNCGDCGLVGRYQRKIRIRCVYRARCLARQIVEQTARYLAAGVVAIVNAFNPCVLVLGGGVIEGIPALLDLAEPDIRKRALPSATANLKILRSSLATNAGCIGAAVLARTGATEEAR